MCYIYVCVTVEIAWVLLHMNTKPSIESLVFTLIQLSCHCSIRESEARLVWISTHHMHEAATPDQDLACRSTRYKSSQRCSTSPTVRSRFGLVSGANLLVPIIGLLKQVNQVGQGYALGKKQFIEWAPLIFCEGVVF